MIYSERLVKKVYKHLLDTKQEFCFLDDGKLISRADCQEILKLPKFVYPSVSVLNMMGVR